MGKPKIIGYKTNYELTYSTPNLPEMTFDSDGVSILWTYLDSDGHVFQAPRYLTNTEVDQMMRECGMKPIYEERQFRAWPAFGGYRVFCRRCKTTTLTGGQFPHDTASRHRCLYDPKDIDDAAS